MKKTEIKESLNCITPDCHLKTRLKANVESHSVKQPKKMNKLAFTTAAICCALIITAIGAGVSLVKEPESTGSISYKHAEGSTADTTPVTKGDNGIFVSNPSWINNVSEDMDTSGITFIVKGENIAEKSYIRIDSEEKSAEISLTAVITALGGEITQYNKSLAGVKLNGVSYELNCEYKSFLEISSDKNLFADENGICLIKARTVNEQYVIDSLSMENLMKNLGYSFKIDYSTKTITIS